MIFNKSTKFIVLLLLMPVLIVSCSKFEDGPAFSLLTAKKRLARDWKVEYSTNLSTGITHSADFDGWILSFKKDGSFSYKVIYNLVQADYTGEWEILGKNQIKLVYSSDYLPKTEFYSILRLTKKELWLENTTEEIHFYYN
jgi:hypothetical protein